MSSHPDIVLLILDTQRADRLSCYGCPLETSLHLDAIAVDSTIFRHAFSTAHWTVPSHTSMFTGVYPSTHNTLHASSMVPSTLPTLAERLHDGGYFTAAFCNNPLVGVVNNGLRRGFLDFFNYSGVMTSRPNRAGVHANFLDRYRQLFKRILTTGLTAMQDVFARSDTLLDFSFSPFMVPLWQTALSFKGNTARSLNDAAQLHIERKGIDDKQPIFSFINLMGTHMPYRPPRHFVERFAPHVLHDREAQRYLHRFNSDVFGWLAPLVSDMDEKYKLTLDGMYNAEVAYQDALVGAFLDKLRVSGRLDRTLLIISADHGEHLGEKMRVGHSMSLYNELVHVPLIIRSPDGDFPCGANVQSFVSTRRIFHTALAVAGMADAQEETFSLARYSDNDPDGGIVFAEAVPALNMLNLLKRHAPQLMLERGFDLTRLAIWSGRHKLIQTGNRQLELYDVFDDPAEEVNLQEALPEVTTLLQGQLAAFENHTPIVPLPAMPVADFDDEPEVLRRLQDLGYIE